MDGTSTKKRYTVEELKKSGHEPVRKIKLILASEPKLSYPEGSVRPKTRGDCEICPVCQEWRDGKESTQSSRHEVSKPNSFETKRVKGNNPPLGMPMRLWESDPSNVVQPALGLAQVVRLSEEGQTDTRGLLHAGTQRLECDDPKMREPKDGEVQNPRSQGDSGMRAMEEELPGVRGQHGTSPLAETLVGQDRQQRQLRTRKLPLGDSQRTEQEPSEQPSSDSRWSNGNNRGMVRKNRNQENDDPRKNPERMERLRCGHTIAEAVSHSRPCVNISCRYNMFLEVSKGGGIRHNFPGIEPEEMVNSCALDLAEKGGMSMEDTARVFGVAKERIRQIELEVQDRMQRAFSSNGEEVVNTREAQNWNLLRSYLKKE